MCVLYRTAVLPRPTAATAAKPAETIVDATSTRGRCSAFLSLEPILPNTSDANFNIILLRSCYVSRNRRRRGDRGHVGHLCRSVVHVINIIILFLQPPPTLFFLQVVLLKINPYTNYSEFHRKNSYINSV